MNRQTKSARWLASLQMGSVLRLLVFQSYCVLGRLPSIGCGPEYFLTGWIQVLSLTGWTS